MIVERDGIDRESVTSTVEFSVKVGMNNTISTCETDQLKPIGNREDWCENETNLKMARGYV